MRSSLKSHRADSGVSLIGMLVVVAVLGAAAAVATMELAGSGSGSSRPDSSLTSVDPSPGAAAGNVAEASRVACVTAYDTVSMAADGFQVTYGTRATSVAQLAPSVNEEASGVGYEIEIDAAGRVIVAAPGHPPSPGDANCSFAG